MDPYSLIFLVLDAGHLAAVVAEEDPPISDPVAISTQKVAAGTTSGLRRSTRTVNP